MTLTSKSAENYAKSLFSKFYKGTELDFSIIHASDVLNCCLLLAKYSKHKNLDLESLKTAAWLHDIGRVEVSDCHPLKSIELAEKQFGKLNPIILDCIKNHGRDSKPETKEGLIFQLSDKMSMLSPELFIVYAKEDKKEAIAYFRKKIEKFLKMAEGFDF